MAQMSGRIGVAPDQVDEFGKIVQKDTSFEDLVNLKLKLDVALLTASDFSSFKEAMIDDNN